MRVLLTNITLASRSGTEINIRDLAIGLLRRGHRPVVYSPELGEIADEIRAATVPVVDDLRAIAAPPEVIHGHHHPMTMAALLAFPGVPAVYHVHDWSSFFDEPLEFPRVVLYAPVDATNADRLELEHGVPRERIRMLLNAVDLERFRPRPGLPARPRRALVMSNYALQGGYSVVVEDACRRAGIELEVVGAGIGRPTARPEDVLAEFDLVFAKGRTALEALAVGAAVVLCDRVGLGGLVTRAELERMRPLNFGRRLLQHPVTVERLAAEIARYDPADAAQVSAWVRREADLELALDRLLGVYHEAIVAGSRLRHSWRDESRAASAYLHRWFPRFRDLDAPRELAALREQLSAREAEVASAQAAAHAELLRRDRAHAAESAALRAELEGRQMAHREEVATLGRELELVTSTATWRWRQRLLRLRPLVALYRWLRRSPRSPA